MPRALLPRLGGISERYAYRVGFWQEFSSGSVAPYERLESLEQLRALHNGHEIRIADAKRLSLQALIRKLISRPSEQSWRGNERAPRKWHHYVI